MRFPFKTMRRRPAAEPAAEDKGVKGFVDGVAGYVVYGWAADTSNFDRSVSVRLLIGGEEVARVGADVFREDLQRHGYGSGRHGFLIEIPEPWCDGREHEAVVLFDDDVQPAKGGRFVLRVPEEETAFDADIEITGGDVVVSMPPGRTYPTGLALEVTTGTERETVPFARRKEGPIARIPMTLQRLRRTLCAGEAALSLAGRPLRLATGLRDVITSGPRLSADLEDERIVVRLHLPFAVDRAPDLVAELRPAPDGDMPAFTAAPMVQQAGGSLLTYVATRPEGLALVTTMTARLAAGEPPLAPPALIARPDLPQSILANETFADWDRDRPTHWRLAEGVVATPIGQQASDRDLGAGGARFTLAEDHNADDQAGEDSGAETHRDDVVLLEQAVPTGILKSRDALQLAVVARSRAAAEMTVVLETTAADGTRHRTTAAVFLSPRWGKYEGAVPVPAASAEVTGARLLVEVPGDIGHCEIGLVTLRLAEMTEATLRALDDRALLDPGSDDAVLNGDFRMWRRGLVIDVAHRNTRLADHWMLRVGRPPPPVTVSAETLVLRDPRAGIRGGPGYAMRIAGGDDSRLRLFAELATASFTAPADRQLRFHAARAADWRPAGSQAPLHRIRLIGRLAASAEADDPRHQDEVIWEIARQVQVEPIGGYHTFPLPRAIDHDIRRLQADGRPLSLLLQFDIAGDCGLRLADVSLRPVAGHGDASPPAGHLALEDTNIARQLPGLRGFADWLAPEPMSPVRDRAGVTPARWRHPRHHAASIQIVLDARLDAGGLADALEALDRWTDRPHLLTVADSSGDPRLAAVARGRIRQRPWQSLLQPDRDGTPTGLLNRAVLDSGADVVVLLSADVTVREGWLDVLLAALLTDETTAASALATAGAGADEDGSDTEADRTDGPRRQGRRVALLPSGCLALRRGALVELGGFAEEAFPDGLGHDLDFCLRAREAGWRLRLAGGHALVRHRPAAPAPDRIADVARVLEDRHPWFDAARIGALLAGDAADLPEGTMPW